MDRRSAFVRAGDELSIRVMEWGQGKLFCVLIHGFGDGAHVWEEFASRLATHCHVVAVDLRGHGESHWDAGGKYTAEGHCEDLLCILRQLGAERVVLVGHSLGGEIAARLAASQITEAAGLVLVDFSPAVDQETAEHILNEFNAESRSYLSVLEYAEELEQRRPMTSISIVRRIAHERLIAISEGEFRLKRDPALGSKENVDLGCDESLWGVLESVRCSTRLIRGAASAVLTSATAKEMESRMLDCETRIVNAAGHNVMLDNPDAYFQASAPFILSMLSRIGG
jgi:pimeloyl-ACP methyl ester carboxylesterase